MHNIISKILGFESVKTYYNWKKEDRLIITFLNSYFSKNELKYIVENNGKCEKLEVIKNFTLKELKEKLDYKEKNYTYIEQYLNSMNRTTLIYLYNILNYQDKIKSSKDMYKFLQLKMKPKSFIDYLKEMQYDLKFDALSLNGYSKNLYQAFKEEWSDEDINYLISNKHKYIK